MYTHGGKLDEGRLTANSYCVGVALLGAFTSHFLTLNSTCVQSPSPGDLRATSCVRRGPGLSVCGKRAESRAGEVG